MTTLQTLYTASAHCVGGRDGRATASDGYPDVSIKPPSQMGGPADQTEHTNPEELFALGYGACFLSAISLVARSQKISARKFEMGCKVDLLAEEGSKLKLAVELHAVLPDIEPEQAHELVRTAHKVCPYSRATRGNIDVRLFVGDDPVEMPPRE